TNGSHRESYRSKIKSDIGAITAAVELARSARRPVFYTGGGVINSGMVASELLTMLARFAGFPVTSTLMGLGAFPASDPQWLGMLGMHGTYEANMAMHDADLIICVGARFDDRITGRLDAFSPVSKKIHVDIDPSSINKNVHVDIPVIGDCADVLDKMMKLWRSLRPQGKSAQCTAWWHQIERWRKRKSLSFVNSTEVIKPQFAIQRLYEQTKDRDTYITTGVGQHQMWAAQHFHFDAPNRFMTSGGLGTMGYGLPAAIGVQLAHPDALVVDIDGDGSFEMTLQQLAVAMQYRLPVKVFILNNQHDGMVRQWQDFSHGGRRAESENDAQPDYVALAKAYGCTGIRCERPDELDEKIRVMLETQGPVVFDCMIAREENCLPMIMSGSPHNEMKLPDDAGSIEASEEGKVMV
ncbi:MAG: acetolactate synthase 3 large subunit, partial [Devosia nanyangense]|nr:acetolactate synthase 3 large subunit [Devosia nanyangense]